MTELEVRLDKYLWAIRLFKTRALASQAIDGGKVKTDGKPVKSSKKVHIGDLYEIKKSLQKMDIKVLEVIKNRVDATRAKECYELINFEDFSVPKNKSAFITPQVYREKGSGRPTKKERRDIDFFQDDL